MDHLSFFIFLLSTGFLLFGQAQGAAQTTSLTLISSSDTGSTHFKQFYSTNNGMNWEQAREFCREHGLELASIDTFKDQYIILEWTFQAEEEWDAFWVSGKADLGVWKWTNSKKVINLGPGNGFQNWADGEPFAGDGITENCLIANLTDQKGKWSSANCGDRNRPLCSTKVNSASTSTPIKVTTTHPDTQQSTPTTTETVTSTTSTISQPPSSPKCNNNYGYLSIGGNISSCTNNYGIINVESGSVIGSMFYNFGTVRTGTGCRIESIWNNYGIVQLGDNSVVSTYTGAGIGIISFGRNSTVQNWGYCLIHCQLPISI